MAVPRINSSRSNPEFSPRLTHRDPLQKVQQIKSELEKQHPLKLAKELVVAFKEMISD